MRRAVAMLAILTTGGLSLAFADPPATSAAPESRSSTAQNNTAEDSSGQNSASQTAPATAAATTAETPADATAKPTAATAAETPVAPANPAPSASDERMQEKLLRDQGYKPYIMNGEKVFCRREIPMGSRLATTLGCLTVAQAELMAREGRELTEHLQHSSPGCLAPGNPRGAPVCH